MEVGYCFFSRGVVAEENALSIVLNRNRLVVSLTQNGYNRKSVRWMVRLSGRAHAQKYSVGNFLTGAWR